MKKTIYLLAVPLILLACAESTGWTENQEIHFYTDCKQKMLDQGETEDNAHAFCECCLLKVKDQYSSGDDAMENLTDEVITRIESECSVTE